MNTSQVTLQLNSDTDIDIDSLVNDSSIPPDELLKADVTTVAGINNFIQVNLDFFNNSTSAQPLINIVGFMIERISKDDRKVIHLNHIFPKQTDVDKFLSHIPVHTDRKYPDTNLTGLLNRPPKQWLIENVFGAGDIGMVYGAPGSGKTFVIIDMIFSACLGMSFAGRFDMKRMLRVAYCAGEGLSGLPQRFQAAALHHNVTTMDNFHFVEDVPQLHKDNATMDKFISEWQTYHQNEPLDLLIIDTLHSAICGANENDAGDMSEILKTLKRATKELGCTVILVHHSNKAGTGERGSSALRGAMDFMIQVEECGIKHKMSCQKLKDGEQWQSQLFELKEPSILDSQSVYTRWDDVSDTANEPNDESLVMDILQTHKGQRFTANQLIEVLPIPKKKLMMRLQRMTDRKTIERCLSNPNSVSSSRNPWLYYIN